MPEKGKAPDPSEVLRWHGSREVGPFKLGDRLQEDLKAALSLTISSTSGNGSSRSFESGLIQDLSVWTWDELITNVTSRTRLYFNDVDLIGLREGELVELFGVAPQHDEIGDGLEHLLWARPLVSADADVEVSVIDGVVRRVSLDNDDPIPDD
jgi:hypothetical protein